MLKSIADFDAILFHGPRIDFQKTKKLKVRDHRQKYVFLNVESNKKYPVCDERFDGFFNWTWTKRFDSDYTCGYLTIKDQEGTVIGPNKTMQWINLHSMKPVDHELKKKLNNKTKAAVCIVSDWKTLRKSETLVMKLRSELTRYELEIDMYGCNKGPNCDLKNMNQFKQHKLRKHYYFHIVLDNYFSDDYATEKLLFALQNYAVPVVFGRANYTRFMPDGIYLNGGELKPKALAKEMSDIIRDKERYYSFFKWHNHYSYHARDESPDTDDLCKMCEMLHDEELMKKTTVYTDFRGWWNPPGSCQSIWG